MREEVLDYVIGGLDESEHADLSRRIEADPELKAEADRLGRRIRERLRLPHEHQPPLGLAARTCEMVFARLDQGPWPAAAEKDGGLSVYPRSGRRDFRDWTFSDTLIAGTVLLAAALLFFPAISQSRYHARLAECQNHLRELGVALTNFADLNNGAFPEAATEGNLAAAGVYAPILRENALLLNERLVICPASPQAEEEDFVLPTRAELEAAKGPELVRLQRKMGGSYGYSLGYRLGGQVVGPRNRARPHFAIMSDMPRDREIGSNSLNHGGRGQNLLFEDGHVRYLSECRLPPTGDLFFANDAGRMEAGLHPDDAVIGASHVPPLPPKSTQP